MVYWNATREFQLNVEYCTVLYLWMIFASGGIISGHQQMCEYHNRANYLSFNPTMLMSNCSVLVIVIRRCHVPVPRVVQSERKMVAKCIWNSRKCESKSSSATVGSKQTALILLLYIVPKCTKVRNSLRMGAVTAAGRWNCLNARNFISSITIFQIPSTDLVAAASRWCGWRWTEINVDDDSSGRAQTKVSVHFTADNDDSFCETWRGQVGGWYRHQTTVAASSTALMSTLSREKQQQQLDCRGPSASGDSFRVEWNGGGEGEGKEWGVKPMERGIGWTADWEVPVQGQHYPECGWTDWTE